MLKLLFSDEVDRVLIGNMDEFFVLGLSGRIGGAKENIFCDCLGYDLV